ncbi:MAG: helix-turn-helix transcriptional regulator [Deltaproteobacteria bacterium]|nr:helix-turn-helix transcriptional regulator [Deltaproteobacteria bacterium]
MGHPDRRDSLVAAAELFAEHGYDNVTLTDVAERAGCARRTVFNHHGSKAGLLVGIVELFFDHLQEWLSASPAPNPSTAIPRCARASPGCATSPSAGTTSLDAERAKPFVDALAAWCQQHRCADLARVALGAMDLPWIQAAAQVARIRAEESLASRLRPMRGAAWSAMFYELLRSRLTERRPSKLPPRHAGHVESRRG